MTMRLGKELHAPKPDEQPTKLEPVDITPSDVATAQGGRTFGEWSEASEISMDEYLSIAEKHPELSIGDIDWTLKHLGASQQDIDEYIVTSRRDSLARDKDF